MYIFIAIMMMRNFVITMILTDLESQGLSGSDLVNVIYYMVSLLYIMKHKKEHNIKFYIDLWGILYGNEKRKRKQNYRSI